MKGIVVFKLTDKGSKSEGLKPYLYTGNGEYVRIYKQGDNPFENRGLKKYDSQCVEIEGEFNDEGEFEISAISLAACCGAAPTKETDEEEFIPVPEEEVDKEFTLSPEEEEVGKEFAPPTESEEEEFIPVPDEEEKKETRKKH